MIQKKVKRWSLQWQGKALRIDRAWYGSTHVLSVWNFWAAAAIRSSTSAILRWYVDQVKIEKNISEHCRWQEPTEMTQ
jgi:hypothetical protein